METLLRTNSQFVGKIGQDGTFIRFSSDWREPGSWSAAVVRCRVLGEPVACVRCNRSEHPSIIAADLKEACVHSCSLGRAGNSGFFSFLCWKSSYLINKLLILSQYRPVLSRYVVASQQHQLLPPQFKPRSQERSNDHRRAVTHSSDPSLLNLRRLLRPRANRL